MHSIGREEARPQRRNTLAVAPILEIRMTVVTCNLSIKLPSSTAPNTAAVFESDKIRVDATEESPMDCA